MSLLVYAAELNAVQRLTFQECRIDTKLVLH